MCKKLNDQQDARNNLATMLCEEVVIRVHDIFEIDREGRADLIGFAALLGDGIDRIMTFFRVDSKNGVHCDGCISNPALGNRGIAAYYGGDYAVSR